MEPDENGEFEWAYVPKEDEPTRLLRRAVGYLLILKRHPDHANLLPGIDRLIADTWAAIGEVSPDHPGQWSLPPCLGNEASTRSETLIRAPKRGE